MQRRITKVKLKVITMQFVIKRTLYIPKRDLLFPMFDFTKKSKNKRHNYAVRLLKKLLYQRKIQSLTQVKD